MLSTNNASFRRSQESSETTSSSSHPAEGLTPSPASQAVRRIRSGSSDIIIMFYPKNVRKVSYEKYEMLFSKVIAGESSEIRGSREQGNLLIQDVRRLHKQIETGRDSIQERIRRLTRTQSSCWCSDSSPPTPIPPMILDLLSFYQGGVTEVPVVLDEDHPLVKFQGLYEDKDIKEQISGLMTTISSLYKKYDKLREIERAIKQ